MRNPYIIGSVVTESRHYGREDLLDDLLHGESRACWVVGNRRIGTTGRGIGPTYESKIARTGIVISDLLDPAIFREKLEANLAYARRVVQEDVPELSFNEIYDTTLRYGIGTLMLLFWIASGVAYWKRKVSFSELKFEKWVPPLTPIVLVSLSL